MEEKQQKSEAKGNEIKRKEEKQVKRKQFKRKKKEKLSKRNQMTRKIRKFWRSSFLFLSLYVVLDLAEGDQGVIVGANDGILQG